MSFNMNSHNAASDDIMQRVAGATGAVIHATSAAVQDIGITLEGRSEDELPEKMIGAARMSYTSMDIGDNIDESDGE